MNVSVNIYIQAFVAEYLSGRNASQNRIGRLMLREDGSGAIEYYYGKMGEVLKTVRTLIVPNQAVATYVTQWKYDSHNRLLEMIYPDEEKVTYGYNLGGQVDHVRGYKPWLRLCEQDWLRQVRAAHLPEVLQRSGNTKKQFFMLPRGAETI